MRLIGVLALTATLVAGCGGTHLIGAAGTTASQQASALAGRSPTFDNLKVFTDADTSKDCSCKAIEASNKKYRLGLQSSNGKLRALAVNGRDVIEDGDWSNSTESIEDPLAGSAELTAIGLDEPPMMTLDEVGRADLEAARRHPIPTPSPIRSSAPGGAKKPSKSARRLLLLGKIYTGLQKAEVASKDRSAVNEVKRGLRAFITAKGGDTSMSVSDLAE